MPANTTGKMQADTDSNAAVLARLDQVAADVAVLMTAASHHDDFLHRIDQGVTKITALIDAHAPALARLGALTDPGASIRDRLRGARK